MGKCSILPIQPNGDGTRAILLAWWSKEKAKPTETRTTRILALLSWRAMPVRRTICIGRLRPSRGPSMSLVLMSQEEATRLAATPQLRCGGRGLSLQRSHQLIMSLALCVTPMNWWPTATMPRLNSERSPMTAVGRWWITLASISRVSRVRKTRHCRSGYRWKRPTRMALKPSPPASGVCRLGL